MCSRISVLSGTAAGLVALLTPITVFAYVGPGAGITAIGSVLALLVGVLLAIVGFIWYPIKRFLRSRSGRGAGGSQAENDMAEEADGQDKH